MTHTTDSPIQDFSHCHEGIVKKLELLGELPALLASAQAGDEKARVQAMVTRLTDEHRALEALWKSLESGLKRVAKGQRSDLSTERVQALVAQYQAHARYEEAEFLPLSQAILGRNDRHMAALGLSLHMRHVPVKIKATYI